VYLSTPGTFNQRYRAIVAKRKLPDVLNIGLLGYESVSAPTDASDDDVDKMCSRLRELNPFFNILTIVYSSHFAFKHQRGHLCR
jgi:hypothetical protein